MKFKKLGQFLVLFFIFTTSQIGHAQPPKPISFMKVLQSGHTFFVNKSQFIDVSLVDGSGQCVLSPGTSFMVEGSVPDGAKTVKAAIYTTSAIVNAGLSCKPDSVVIVNVPDLKNIYNEFARYYGTDEEAYGD